MEDIIIFTDGSSRGNPGPGGFGAIIVSDKKVKEIGGGEQKTTNNRMELKACIEALKYVQDSNLKPKSVKLFTDSSYVVNGITKWVYSWERRNWTTVNKEPVLNKDLWETLLELVKGKNIEWKQIEGHVGVRGNERADIIATAFADGENISLYDGSFSLYDIQDILDMSLDSNKKLEKDSTKKKSAGKAYSYVSEIAGKVEVHKVWAECEARVKGKKARFKKVFSAEEEKVLMADWSR